MKTIIIYTKQKFTGYLPLVIKHLEGTKDLYPENRLSFADQLNYTTQHSIVVTNSPYIVAGFRRDNVFTFEDGKLIPVTFETYGADIAIIAKKLNGLETLMPVRVIECVREKMREGNAQALEFLETLGSSAEKAYLRKN